MITIDEELSFFGQGINVEDAKFRENLKAKYVQFGEFEVIF